MQNAGLINGFRRMWESKTGSCSRLQFPFSLAWAKEKYCYLRPGSTNKFLANRRSFVSQLPPAFKAFHKDARM
ncbi:hypothetical protein RIR_jg32414.t1 [Rhizophagus irregularis DAOM 181602=DAOM 197198]|uniref:Uncharacterized protein n=1 Tax=Rhizophagus irregularis (strain DAOM 181602 / DAOM 197198 / MUCL 43194) TaxID=747089 RepID=U9TX47_RHIID|nr:hypothetical protein RIR_jg32414.t1 [Rhizophagus irregularis DAOM 181602=DAOM 197198]